MLQKSIFEVVAISMSAFVLFERERGWGVGGGPGHVSMAKWARFCICNRQEVPGIAGPGNDPVQVFRTCRDLHWEFLRPQRQVLLQRRRATYRPIYLRVRSQISAAWHLRHDGVPVGSFLRCWMDMPQGQLPQRTDVLPVGDVGRERNRVQFITVGNDI
jgi:hypothetical protein